MRVVTKTGLHLTLGKKVMATLHGEKYQVALRGWVENEYLIVDYPQFQGDFVNIAPLTGCSLSFTSEGSYFDFKTLVLYSIAQPVRLMAPLLGERVVRTQRGPSRHRPPAPRG